MGTELIARFGARPTDVLARWNVERPDAVAAVHRAYAEAGAGLLTTNTLLAPLLGRDEGAALVRAGVALARSAAPGRPVALSLGPDGDPAVYADLAAAGVEAGASLIQLETFTDVKAAASAVRAVIRSVPGVPVAVLVVFRPDGAVLGCGTPAADAARLLLNAGAGVTGANCAPPDALAAAVAGLDDALPPGVPLVLRPSAGIPFANGESFSYPWAPAPWAASVRTLAAGARSHGRSVCLGGCCGAGPGHIAALAEAESAAPS
jgi:5-methyltetrahydrofolate--homocysteine methyltransferase